MPIKKENRETGGGKGDFQLWNFYMSLKARGHEILNLMLLMYNTECNHVLRTSLHMFNL